MDDPARMSAVERVCNFLDDSQHLVHWELLALLETLTKRRAVDERHDVVAETTSATRIVERDNVRVLQPRGDPHLALEAFLELRRGAVLPHDLDRDHAVVPQ